MDEAMRKKLYKDSKRDLKTWSLDHLTKGVFFHQQLYDLITITTNIEETKDETLDWKLNSLGISNLAWNKIIHRGIKPVIVFSHPIVLKTIPGSIGYYRMLSMVSQKSMNRVGLSAVRYESGKTFPDDENAVAIARHLNQIISRMIKLDDQIDAQEFKLWRGMAAGSQVQCSWQNNRKRKQA
jgi:hypothetical protein